MSVDLVGLAYDEKLTDQVWNETPAGDVVELILDDEFRRKVDPRSLLYHKGLLDLLTELEPFLRQGGTDLSLVQLLAKRFQAGVEDFPGPSGELLFDFKLIRQFASLAMVDDFVTADTCLRALLRRTGFLKGESGWSLLETRDYPGVARALKELKLRDIFHVGETLSGEKGRAPLERLVRNYIEFLSYAENNRLAPFFYNSESDLKRWGNLMERKNRRAEKIVDTGMRPVRAVKKKAKVFPEASGGRDFGSRFRRRLEAEALLSGLKDPDPVIRQKAAESLGKVAGPEILPALEAAIPGSEAESRQELVRAVAVTGDPRSEEILLRVAESDEVQSVQLLAASLLRKQGARCVIPALLAGLESGKPHYAVLLARHPALGTNRSAQSKLTELAADREPFRRRDAAFVLGHVPTKTSREILKRLTSDEDEDTRISALYAIWGFRDPFVKKASERFTHHASEGTARAGTILRHWSKSLRS